MTDKPSKLTMREIFEKRPIDRIFHWRVNRPSKPTTREEFLARMRPRKLATNKCLAVYRRECEEPHSLVWQAKRLPKYIERAILDARQTQFRRESFYGLDGPIGRWAKYYPPVVLAQLRRETLPAPIEIARWWANCVIKDADAQLQRQLTSAERRISEDRARHAKRVGEVQAVVSRLERQELRKVA